MRPLSAFGVCVLSPLLYSVLYSSLGDTHGVWCVGLVTHHRFILGKQGYDVKQLIAEADEDGNGVINLQEFCTHMRKRYGM